MENPLSDNPPCGEEKSKLIGNDDFSWEQSSGLINAQGALDSLKLPKFPLCFIMGIFTTSLEFAGLKESKSGKSSLPLKAVVKKSKKSNAIVGLFLGEKYQFLIKNCFK